MPLPILPFELPLEYCLQGEGSPGPGNVQSADSTRIVDVQSWCRAAGRPGFGAVRFPFMGVKSLRLRRYAVSWLIRPQDKAIKSDDRLSTECLPLTFVGTLRDIIDAGGVQRLTLSTANKTGPVEPGAWYQVRE